MALPSRFSFGVLRTSAGFDRPRAPSADYYRRELAKLLVGDYCGLSNAAHAVLTYLETANDPSPTVDLERCLVETPRGRAISFAIAPGLSSGAARGASTRSVGSCNMPPAISAFQASDATARPWIDRRARTDRQSEGLRPWE
jgi:hypothetical protein